MNFNELKKYYGTQLVDHTNTTEFMCGLKLAMHKEYGFSPSKIIYMLNSSHVDTLKEYRYYNHYIDHIQTFCEWVKNIPK